MHRLVNLIARLLLSSVVCSLVVRDLFLGFKSKDEGKAKSSFRKELYKSKIGPFSCESLLRIISFLVCLVSFALWLVTFETKKDVPFREIAGCLVVCLGSLVRYKSRLELGSYFSHQLGIYDIHDIVKTGPYEQLRHPYYTGGLLVAVGACIFVDNIPGVVFILSILFIYIFFRIPIEENMMLKRFGNHYEQFCETRKRLIPHTY